MYVFGVFFLSLSIIFLKFINFSSVSKESTCNAGDPGSIPGSGRSAGEGMGYPLQGGAPVAPSWASLVAQLVKNLPAMWETWVRSMGWEDPLEKGKATHSRILAGEFYGLYSPKESDTTERHSLSLISRLLPLYRWIVFSFMDVQHFISSLVDEHLNCFWFLAIINNVSVNIHVRCTGVYIFISPG